MNTLQKSIATGVIGIALLVSGSLLVSAFGQQHASFGSFNPTGGGTYVLKSSVSSTQSSITLSSFTEPGSNIPYTMSYLNSDIEYGTINPSSGNSEFVSFTGITQNSDGSATLTGVTRGLARTPGTGGCVASSTLARSYGGQTQFVLSNPPCFYAEFAKLRNTQSVTGVWTYASTAPPRLDSVAAQASGTYIATTSEFASIAYVDAVAFSGASNADQSTKGIVQIATAAQAASSTALAGGSTGATLVLPTSFATDTPTQSSVSATKLVMSDLTGYIRQTWLDLTKQWNFSALFATNASTTNATTTRLWLSGITSSLLKTDSNGKVAAATVGTDYTIPSYSYASSSSAIISATNGYASTSAALTVPAGVLTASSTIDIRLNFTCNNGAGSGQTCLVYVRDSAGKTFASCAGYVTNGASAPFGANLLVVGTTSAAQATVGYSTALGFYYPAPASSPTSGGTCNGYSSVNLASSFTPVIVVYGPASVTTSLQGYAITINP